MEAFRLLLVRGIEVTKYSSGKLRRPQDRVLFLRNATIYVGKTKYSKDAKRFELAAAGCRVSVEECDELSNFKLVLKWHCTRDFRDKDLACELNVNTYFCKEKLVSLLQQLINTYEPHGIVHSAKNASITSVTVDNPLACAP
jgi:hypothetical protein